MRHTPKQWWLTPLILREKIAGDTNFFLSHIRSRSAPCLKPLCFVDEVQKSEAVFDAIKVAWDDGIDFIISGSNPEYLETQASMRLQRRSVVFDLKPLSLPEILCHEELLGKNFSLYDNEQLIFSILDGSGFADNLDAYIKSLRPAKLETILEACRLFLIKGGLPRAHRSKSVPQAFSHVRATVERGFSPILQDTLDIFDIVTVELASASSTEFTYENFFQRTRTKNRDRINQIIAKLKGHGYLKEKRPYIPDGKSSYFVTYSFIDPGMISYLTDTLTLSPDEERRVIESYVHARLDHILSMQQRKSTLCYYKPYTIRHVGDKDELRFKAGEIDFVVYFGPISTRKATCIEVKRTVDIPKQEVHLLTESIAAGIFKCGIVMYGGMPYIDKKQKILYWPWWLL